MDPDEFLFCVGEKLFTLFLFLWWVHYAWSNSE